MTITITQDPRHSVDRRRRRRFVGRGLQVERLTHAHVLRVVHALREEPGPDQAFSLGLMGPLRKMLKVRQLMLAPSALLAMLLG